MIVPSSVFHLLLRPPPDRGVIALDLRAPGNPGSASPLGKGRRMRVVPIAGVRDSTVVSHLGRLLVDSDDGAASDGYCPYFRQVEHYRYTVNSSSAR